MKVKSDHRSKFSNLSGSAARIWRHQNLTPAVIRTKSCINAEEMNMECR